MPCPEFSYNIMTINYDLLSSMFSISASFAQQKSEDRTISVDTIVGIGLYYAKPVFMLLLLLLIALQVISAAEAKAETLSPARQLFTQHQPEQLTSIEEDSLDIELGEEITTEADSDYRSTGEDLDARLKGRQDSSLISKILLFLPNRILDLTDIIRLRARLGPGVALGARITEYVQAYLGSYTAVYAGWPGPGRRKFWPHSPLGLETHNGFTISTFDATIDAGFSPQYSPSEVGVSVHLLLVGADAGFDPVEFFDFFAGWWGEDFCDDDL